MRANDPAARQQGMRHITWGIIGLVVMLSAYTIMLVFASAFGLDDELIDAKDGRAPFGTGGGILPGNSNTGSGTGSGNSNTGSGIIP